MYGDPLQNPAGVAGALMAQGQPQQPQDPFAVPGGNPDTVGTDMSPVMTSSLGHSADASVPSVYTQNQQGAQPQQQEQQMAPQFATAYPPQMPGAVGTPFAAPPGYNPWTGGQG